MAKVQGRRRSAILSIFLTALSAAVVLSGCGAESESPSANALRARAEARDRLNTFWGDADGNAVKESLGYKCADPGASGSNYATGTYGKAIALNMCSISGASQSKFVLKVEWRCTQTDSKKFGRPMPARHTVEIPTTLEISKNQASAKFDFGAYEKFIGPMFDGNTDYLGCFIEFKMRAANALELEIENRMQDSCGAGSYFELAARVGEQLFGRLENDDGILKKSQVSGRLSPILPFYDTIEFGGELDNIRSCMDASLHGPAPEYRVIPRYSLAATASMSRRSMETDLRQSLISNSGCGSTVLSMSSPTNLLPVTCRNLRTGQKVVNSSWNSTCEKLAKYADEMYTSLDRNLLKPQSSAALSEIFKDYMSENETIEKSSEKFRQHESQVRAALAKESYICEDVAIGDVRVAQNRGREYRLTRTDAQTFDVRIRVGFSPSCSISEIENQKLANSWLNRVNKCLAATDAVMKDPAGRMIRIRLESTKHSALRATTVLVLGDDRQMRENEYFYTRQTDCSTLLHEVLHLTGLVDEYRETEKEYKNFDGTVSQLGGYCRALGPADSVMRSQFDAVMASATTKKSLLKPAHARFILYPGCEQKNGIYYKCMKRAYDSDAGQVCTDTDLPPECANGSTAWIDN